ncbi:hypothetical protein EC562_10050 [Vibrio parahaemolyticus]|uniref:hypothetical protein n=1 Tax=Vibrio sp. 1288 TaxID=3074550 RepID=UPI0029672C1A|nr:hypothetical protein [Vibrio sp. 1288]EGR1143187.1 hypothetical protein [Vibrio parahaemolyticus]MDW3137092.1 hypothetical protein [Vibrio sp. 1288]
MSTALSAQVVIDISLDTDNSKLCYTVVTNEGGCSGINQLAEKLTKKVLLALPECAKPQGIIKCQK